MALRGEGGDCDLKVDYDPEDPKAKLELVKDLVAFANAGGGQIKFGYTETKAPGVPRSLMHYLDGAKLIDQANRYVAPGTVHVSHAVEELFSEDRVGIIVTIDPCGKYPLVFSKDGDWGGGKTSLFRRGDIYTRHGAKSERADLKDIMWFIDRAVESSRGELMKRIDQLVRLPDGYEIKFVPPKGEELADPNNLLATAAAQRLQNRAVVLSARDLLWCWKNRGQIDLTDTNADLLIRSALRRTPTLYLWLIRVKDRPDFVSGILLSTMDDPDRDKSDAGRALLEVGALVAPYGEFELLLERLANSRYAHFQEAAQDWADRSDLFERVFTRVKSAKWNGELLAEVDDDRLVQLADELVESMLQDGKSTKASRVLGDVGRVLFLRAIGRLSESET